MNPNDNDEYEGSGKGDDASLGDFADEEEEDSDEETPVETAFADLCHDLWRNDPETTTVDPVFLPSSYGVRLGEALEGNTHVSHLTLEVDSLPEAHVSVDALAPLLGYIQRGPALRMLVLRADGEIVPQTLNRLLAAATANNRLEELHLNVEFTIAHNLDALCALIEQTTSIRRLIIVVDHELDEAPLERLALALGLNRTLDALTLCPGHYPTFINACFLHLSTHPCVRELILDYEAIGDGEYFELSNVQGLLESKSSRLCHLQLGGYAFTNLTLQSLLTGLSRNQTLERLTFFHCHWENDTSAQFVDFMRQPRNGSKLHHLGVVSFGNPSFAVRLLGLSKTCAIGGTVGAIDTLTLDLGTYYNFFRVWAAHASRIRLAHLELVDLPNDDWQHLERSLPNFCYLRELTLTSQVNPVQVGPLLRALRRSGSLLQVHLSSAQQARLTADESRHLHAYLARNRHVAE